MILDMYFYNKKSLRGHRKDLRNNATPQEITLWNHLKDKRMLGYKFRRQHSIGPYIVDFCCPLRKLIIEIDGSQHLENQEYDNQRTFFFNNANYRVLRFWNNEITTHLTNVLEKISQVLTPPRPLGTPPYNGRGDSPTEKD